MTAAATLVVLCAGCGAALAPPARSDVDFAASRAFTGAVEVGFGGDSGGIFQGTLRAPVAEMSATTGGRSEYLVGELWYFGHDVPSEEYGWALAGAGLRAPIGHFGKTGRLTAGSGVAAGCGGRYPGWEKGDTRCPAAMAAYFDVGVAVGFTDWLTGFAAYRVSRGWTPGRRDDRRPPTTDWHHVGAGIRADVGPFYSELHAGTASYSNHYTDDTHNLLGLSVGYRFDGK